MRLFLEDVGVVCALGRGKTEVWSRASGGDTRGMVTVKDIWPEHAVICGRVDSDGVALPSTVPASHDTRNNRILFEAIEQIRPAIERVISKYGRDRVGVVIGTSTSGLQEAFEAVSTRAREGSFPSTYHFHNNEMGSPAVMLASALSLTGPAWVVSTACTSSANALLSARRLIALGLVDAVIVGGADTLCALTLAGFTALESVSQTGCKPLSKNRDGLSIGEGAAVFVLSRDDGPVELLGLGASTDAHHMSAPHPEGRGAARAMQHALTNAKLDASAIDYVNLHGTGTPLNDAMELRAMAQVFGTTSCPTVSSTKAMTGHALGAAAAIELALCFLALSPANEQRALPRHVWDGARDSSLPEVPLATRANSAAKLSIVMSNSFAFGGNNVSCIVGRAS